MKMIKIIMAILLSALLAVTACLAMGSIAVSKAISEESIEKAIVETGAVEELTDDILRQNTTNLGGKYGDVMQTILKSDAMTDFFAAYTASCLQSQIYDEDYPEIGSDDLNAAFSRGIDECVANGSISMDDFERKLFDSALNMVMPTLTEGINYVFSQMNLTSFVDENTAAQIANARTAASDEVRYGSMAAGIVLGLILILLFWRSKMGMIWCAAVILIVSALFILIAFTLSESTVSESSIALSARMMYVMASDGLWYAGAAGGALGCLLVLLCPVLRKIF